MAKRHLPSIEALTSNDDHLLCDELRLSEVRTQVELARALLEQLELGGEARPRAAEALARLGCRIAEIATSLSRAP